MKLLQNDVGQRPGQVVAVFWPFAAPEYPRRIRLGYQTLSRELALNEFEMEVAGKLNFQFSLSVSLSSQGVFIPSGTGPHKSGAPRWAESRCHALG